MDKAGFIYGDLAYKQILTYLPADSAECFAVQTKNN